MDEVERLRFLWGDWLRDLDRRFDLGDRELVRRGSAREREGEGRGSIKIKTEK